MKMRIGDKIRRLIEEAGYKKPGAFYKALCEMHGEYAIGRKTFYNLLNHRTPPRTNTLFQVGSLLKKTNTELCEGTDEELQPMIDEKPYTGEYAFNDKAKLYAYHLKSAPYMPLKLVLRTGGQTLPEKDSPEAQESFILVWVIVGKITVVIKNEVGEERRELHNGQMTSFDGRKSHYYINESKTNSVAHIIHYPAQNSSFYSKP